ncbi:hypothetical protein YC2023_032712 [Brassica napus]
MIRVLGFSEMRNVTHHFVSSQLIRWRQSILSTISSTIKISHLPSKLKRLYICREETELPPMAINQLHFSDLKDECCKKTIVAQILRFWDARDLKKVGEHLGLDLVFLDKKVSTF